MNETRDVTGNYELPELPEEYDGEDSAQLVLSRENDVSIMLADSVSIPDAREYCSREDTHGDGWFVCYYEN